MNCSSLSASKISVAFRSKDTSLDVASVGEPLNPEVIRWGMKVFEKRIHDTWWMTETGAQLICNYPTILLV